MIINHAADLQYHVFDQAFKLAQISKNNVLYVKGETSKC